MKEIRFVIDGPPGKEPGRFVEVENELGHSIRVGTWVQKNNHWFLRLTSADFPAQDDQWRPIETAPEDEVILVYVEPDWVASAFYIIDDDTQERIWLWDCCNRMHENHLPVAWMPTPAPPKILPST